MSRSVLMVSQPTVSGVAQCVLDWSSGLQQRDWSVTVACPRDGWLGNALRERDVPVLAWESVREPTQGLKTESTTLRDAIRRSDPDVVFLHGSKAGLIGRLVTRGRRPTAFAPHAWSFEAVTGRTRSAALAWERFASRWTSRFICVSDAERELGETAGITGAYTVARNGIDLEALSSPDLEQRQALRRTVGLSPTERAVVCVGRICRQKGQDVLLDAWSRLPGDDRSLTLVGGGPDLDSLRERWSSPDIRFTGETDRRTALDWMAAADLVVLPSRWEGLALVPLESLAVGTPVVATDVNGTREVLTEGVGSVVPIEDSVRLAAAIEEWLKKLGGDGVHQRCRNRVAESFDLTDTVTRIDRALLEISGGGR